MPEAATSRSARGRKAVVSSGTAGRSGYGLRRFVPLAVIIALAAAVYAMGWHHALSLENLVRHHAALSALVDRHLFLALLAYLALYVAAVTLSLPCGAILSTTGGVLFGGLIGGVAAILGATIGATCLFLIARSAFGEFLMRRAGPRLTSLAAGFREDAFSYLLFLRLVPVFPFFLVNLAPAFVGVKLGPFFAATLLGIIPATFAFAFVGAGFDDLVALTQIKMPCTAKLEMARNYWDEMGRGNAQGMHGPMLTRLAAYFDVDAAPERVCAESLALGNTMVALANNRRYAFHSIGALGAIEMTAPGRALHVERGLRRLKVPGKQRQYFSLHAILDVKHSDAWNREVVRPLVAGDPRCAQAIGEGAVLRLWHGARCFERYRSHFRLGTEPREAA